MNGTVNPLYGGNNINGGTGAGEQARRLAQSRLGSSWVGTKDPIRGLTEHAAASVYKQSLSADEIVKGLKDITNTIKTTSTFTSDKITSIILTVMQALSNSFTGGMNGMKAELEKITKEQEGSDDSAMVDFLVDCGSFLSFFIQYSSVNKQLQYKITHPDDDDLLTPDQKNKIKRFKDEFSNGEKEINDIKIEITNLISTLDKNIDKQYLKKLNNIELEFYQEKLNNAFQYLTFTYGQLSGRTLYNLSKLLAAGGAKDVGLFAPISLPSLTGSAVRMVPGAGPVLDTINDFFSSFSTAFKMSYKALKDERELASDYIQNNIELSKTLNLKGGVGNFIKEETFKKLIKPSHTKNEKNKESRKNKDYNKDAINIARNRDDKTAVRVPEFSKVRAERDLKLLNEILSEYYHVMSLMDLIKIISEGESEGDSIYRGDEKKDGKLLKLQKITTDELGALQNNAELKVKFVGLYKTLTKTINESKPDTLLEVDKKSIEKNNPVLYGIVKDFIKTTYENLGQEEEEEKKGAEEEEEEENKEDTKKKEEEEKKKKKKEEEEEIKKSLVKLIVDNLDPTVKNEEDDNDNTIKKFLNKQEEDKKNAEQERKTSLMKEKNQQTGEQITKLNEILGKEKDRINDNLKTDGAGTDIPSIIGEYKSIIEQNLQHYNDELLAKIGAEIVASNSFKPLKKEVKKYKTDLKSGVKKIIDDFKAEYNKDYKKENEQEKKKKQLIYSAFDKLLKFIEIKNFEAVNTGLAKFEKYAEIVDKKINKVPQAGGMRSSTIKRRIKKATRRIQLSLDEFNSGRNTRRGRYRKKPRKTRRVNYGH
tara:strand:+ start:4080 stop:6539 length:2460 start_codon:yes stop_codon:yes gene_type:complete